LKRRRFKGLGDVAGKFRLWKMLQEPQPNCYAPQRSRTATGER
jgi:hypothetical protein